MTVIFGAVSIGRSQIETAPDTVCKAPCGKAFQDHKKRKWEKQQEER